MLKPFKIISQANYLFKLKANKYKKKYNKTVGKNINLVVSNEKFTWFLSHKLCINMTICLKSLLDKV